MENSSSTKSYKWDVAISLCSKDIDFAKKLVKAINPTLKVFFYEDNQAEFISKSGPVACAKTFKEESRVVVILSRNEWSNSFYTEIERNAIIDRISVRNEGYQFLMVIPMVQDEIPLWYPSTQIYASPFRFSIEELAHFIEFKVTAEGGVVKSLTVEERYQNLIDRIELKKSIIDLQNDKVAAQYAEEEMNALKNCFNKKSNFLLKRIIDNTFFNGFDSFRNYAHFGHGGYLLECRFMFQGNFYYKIRTTQDAIIEFELFKGIEEKKSLELEQRVFYYTQELQGWALPQFFEPASNSEAQVLFRNKNNTQFYDLIKPIQTDALVDYWFQRFLSTSTEVIERHI